MKYCEPPCPNFLTPSRCPGSNNAHASSELHNFKVNLKFVVLLPQHIHEVMVDSSRAHKSGGILLCPTQLAPATHRSTLPPPPNKPSPYHTRNGKYLRCYAGISQLLGTATLLLLLKDCDVFRRLVTFSGLPNVPFP